MAFIVEFETYMEYAATTSEGQNLCDLPVNIQERLNEVFDDATLDSANHPDNVYVNGLQIITLKDLYDWDTVTRNFDLPEDEDELEQFFYDNEDEILDVLNEEYIVLGTDKTDIYLAY